MEETSLEQINENVLALKKRVEEMKELLIEDELELSDEVVKEIEESRKKPESSFVSHEDIMAEFS